MSAVHRVPAKDGAEEIDLETLMRRHHRALLAYAARLTSDPDEAADLVQETMVRVWRRGPARGSHRSVRSRLQTVLHNLVIDAGRRRAARPPEVLAGSSLDVAELLDAHGIDPPARDPSGAVVDRLAVLQLFQPLKHFHLSVVQKLYLDGLSTTETADALRIPVGTVKSRNHQAMQLMRRTADLDQPARPPAGPDRPAGSGPRGRRRTP